MIYIIKTMKIRFSFRVGLELYGVKVIKWVI